MTETECPKCGHVHDQIGLFRLSGDDPGDLDSDHVECPECGHEYPKAGHETGESA